MVVKILEYGERSEIIELETNQWKCFGNLYIVWRLKELESSKDREAEEQKRWKEDSKSA